MKMDQLIEPVVLQRLPVAFQYFRAIDKKRGSFIDRYVPVKRYQSLRCSVNPPLKPLSKMI